jgi:hypothetical protein
MYVDTKGVSKKLPVNSEATELNETLSYTSGRPMPSSLALSPAIAIAATAAIAMAAGAGVGAGAVIAREQAGHRRTRQPLDVGQCGAVTQYVGHRPLVKRFGTMDSLRERTFARRGKI